MKAAFINETGDAGVIQYGDLPDPEPQSGEVLVRVGAVAVNPIDTYIRGGAVAIATSFYIIGCDLAGTVEAVGPECTRFKLGPSLGQQPEPVRSQGDICGTCRRP